MEDNRYRASALFSSTIPLGWLTGLTPVFAILYVAFIMRDAAPRSRGAICLFTLAATLLASAFLAHVVLGYLFADLGRMIAALYNIAVICMAALVFEHFSRSGERIIKSICGPMLFVFVCGTLLIFYESSLNAAVSFPALILGRLPNLPGILSFFGNIRLAAPDYGTGEVYLRPYGFGIYFTEGALIYAYTAVYSSIYFRSSFMRIAVLTTALFILFLMASRTILLAYITGWILTEVLRNTKVFKFSIVFFLTTMSAILLFSALAPSVLPSWIDSLNEMRANSNKMRMESYERAIALTSEINPFTGLGVKPTDESTMNIPIGSHSTFISLFTKGGILSLSVFFVFLIISLGGASKVAQLRMRAKGGSWEFRYSGALLHMAIISAMWFVTEDFDAPIYGALLTFGVLGALCTPTSQFRPRYTGGLGGVDKLATAPTSRSGGL